MENSHRIKLSHLESTLRIHDKVSSYVVEHDRVLFAPLLKFTPNYTERFHVYHSVSEIYTNLMYIQNTMGPAYNEIGYNEQPTTGKRFIIELVPSHWPQC